MELKLMLYAKFMTDEQLVQEFLGGNEDSLEKLVEKYLKPIYNFTYQLTRDNGASQDITQDVFVKVWKNINSFDETKKFSTWLYAIAKNTTYDFLKKKKTIPFSAFENVDGFNILENIEDETILHSNALLQRIDNIKDAEEFLDTLSPQLKTILLLHHQQGFSLVEIAEIMGNPTNTIKSKYRRAILSLRGLYSSKSTKNKIAPETFPAS
jgi:RNA polymerase sigma-70 factor (ECF subfamily)